ncbi:MAG: hypothetical protein ACFE0I_03110 [Elainellaceae cyanobacterium]
MTRLNLREFLTPGFLHQPSLQGRSPLVSYRCDRPCDLISAIALCVFICAIAP